MAGGWPGNRKPSRRAREPTMKMPKTLSSASDLAAIRSRIVLVGPTDTRLWGSMSAPRCSATSPTPSAARWANGLPRPSKARPSPSRSTGGWPSTSPANGPTECLPRPSWISRSAARHRRDFAADRAALLAKLDQFARATGPWSPHPMFGADDHRRMDALGLSPHRPPPPPVRPLTPRRASGI